MTIAKSGQGFVIAAEPEHICVFLALANYIYGFIFCFWAVIIVITLMRFLYAPKPKMMSKQHPVFAWFVQE